MATISISKTNNVVKEKAKSISLYNRYLAYIESQQKESFYWYILSILVFPCVVMVPTIFVMEMVTTSYVWFISLSVLLFYSNMMAHIGGAKSTVFVPLYHATVTIMVLIPFITYLVG